LSDYLFGSWFFPLIRAHAVLNRQGEKRRAPREEPAVNLMRKLIIPAIAAGVMLAAGAVSASAATGGTATQQSPVKAATTAHASAVPAADILCSGDLCIQDFVGDVSQTVHAWADTSTFFGHFELEYGCSIAGCNIANSDTQWWPAGGTHWSFTYTSAIVAQCVWAWKGPSNGTYTQIGEKCWSGDV
jgi:hypothetical protein